MISDTKTKSTFDAHSGLWLGAVMVLAFLLRVTGIHFGLPDIFHQDEPIVVNHAMAYGSGDFNPHFFKLPPLTSYVAFFLYGLYFLILCLFGYSKEDFILLFFRDPGSFYLIGRLALGALLGSASVALVYHLAARFLEKKAALIASLFLAVNFLHARDSHYIYADIPMLFSMLMALYCLSKSEPKKSFSGIGWASFWCAAATAFKYLAVPIVLSGILFLAKQKKYGAPFGRWLWASVGIYLAGYAMLNPYNFLDWDFFLKEILAQMGAEGHTSFFHHLVYSVQEGSGWLLLVTGVVGLAVLAINQPTERWWIAFPVVFFLMISVFSQSYERYAMPLVPFLGIGSAFFISSVAGKFRGAYKNFVLAGCVMAVCLVPLIKTLKVDLLMMLPDTRTQAREWILSSIPEASGIVLDHPFFSPRLTQVPEQMREKAQRVNPADPQAALKEMKNEWLIKAQAGDKKFTVFYLSQGPNEGPAFLQWSPVVPAETEALKKSGARYFVRYRYPGESSFFKSELQKTSRLVAVFSPYQDATRIWSTDSLSHVGLPFRADELFARKFAGPYLEIYELNL